MSVNSIFNSFISDHLVLSKKDISSAVKSREWLIERLIKAIKDDASGPQLYKENGEEFIYFGSYFKGTKVSDTDEFDVLLIIDSKNGQLSTDGVKIGNGIGIIEPNPKYYNKFKKSDGTGVSPFKILNWLKNKLDIVLEPFGCEPVEREGQAITAYIKSKDLSIDFVPGGIFENINNGQIFYNIPKGDQKGNWIITNPRIDKDIINRLGKNYEQFKSSIRLFKYLFKNSYNLSQISSYIVECIHVTYESEKNFYDDFEFDFPLLIEFFIEKIDNEFIPDMRDNSNLFNQISNKDACLNKLTRIKNKYNDIDKQSSELKSQIYNMLKNE